MPLIDSREAIPFAPSRILVAGTSGSGKTTLAVELAASLHLPHIEIDGLFHGPGWTPRPSFEVDVRDFAAQDVWVTEWQYSEARTILADRADLVVWLDLPRHRVMRQIVGRTLRRRVRREVLWNGNVEPPLRTILTDHEHIIRWAWTSHRSTEKRVRALAASHPYLPIVRLRSHAEAERWLHSLAG